MSEEMEIKFRAWNSLVKKMLHFANPLGIMDNEDRYGMFLESLERRMYCGGNYTLMQFSGLRDSMRTEEYPKGQEIYDKDVLRYYSDARMYVPSKDGKWKYEGNPHLEERTVVEYSDEYGAYMVHGGSCYLHEINDKSEVIGNICENPELMEGWK